LHLISLDIDIFLQFGTDVIVVAYTTPDAPKKATNTNGYEASKFPHRVNGSSTKTPSIAIAPVTP
jgi:hypothetical protein